MANPQTPNRDTKPANAGVKTSDPTPKPAEAAKPGPDADDSEEKTRGVIPQMPTCVVWREPGGKVVANLIHPRTGQRFFVTGKGVNGTMGTLGDEGYPLGGLRTEGPKWVTKFIPQGVEILGFAPVLGFPIPSQS